MLTSRRVGLFALALLSNLAAIGGGALPGFFEQMAAATGLDWMRGADLGAPLSFGDSRDSLSFEVSTSREIVVKDQRSGRSLTQTQRWLPELGVYQLETREKNGGKDPDEPRVNVIDWTFQLPGRFDGARFQDLDHSQDTWYGSTYWTGPDWTRVGKDWQHPGERTSSVRRFTAPCGGTIVISGNVCKADTNGGDGVRVSIRHNADVVWQQEIGASDAQGLDPALPLEVRKGDRLRFVVHRQGAIPCDTTHWDPVITYADGRAFRASDAFGAEATAGWSYEMEMEQEANLPQVYSFDRHFCFHHQAMAPGNEIVLDHDADLPLFILADEHDAGGIVGAVTGAQPWQFHAALSEDGRLTMRIQSEADGPLPEVVVGPYKGNWMHAAAMLERLHQARERNLNLRHFQKRIGKAFDEILGGLDPRSRPELDMWAEIQWDWHRQDALVETPEGYETAILAVREKSAELAGDLGCAATASKAGEWSEGAPCLRYLRAHALRRKIALANPLMGFGKLLFCKRAPTSYSHLVMQYYGWRARPGGSMFVLDEPGYSFAARDIFDGALDKGSILEPRLSYDAQCIVFSYVESAGKEYDPLQLDNAADEGFYHLWEANVDGSGLRQITRGAYDDLMPAYLPDGGIVFSSTRREGYARCFGAQFSPRWHVYALHRVDPDGQNLRALSYHDTNEWFPTVSNAGMILYSRWDYIDRDAVTHQTLWGTRPDGTNPVAIWGNATEKPHCTFQMQPIPGSQKIVFTASAHHSITGGPIVVVDPGAGNNGQEALTRITRGIPFPEAESNDIREYYDAPWPLSEKYFLASYSPWPLVWEPGANLPNALGIYLIDAFGNRELIYRDPAIGSTNAVPLALRPVPPVLSGTLPNEPPHQGEVIIADVYQGLGDVARGTIKSVRIVQIFPKSTPVGGTPPVGLAGEENARAVLGEVPVEADGSAHFTVPARKPVLFQLLDEDGMAYQTMRSVTYVQPGEKVSCIGCHESQKTAPANHPPAAARRPASSIAPGPLENEPFSYILAVQPVLDKYCVRCHSGPEPSGQKDLTGVPHNGFSRSYWALCGDHDFAGLKTNSEIAAAALVPRFGMRNQIQMTSPGGAFGARGSRLLRMIREGHHEVRLEREELRRLAQWIDCNAVFYGGYLPEEQARQLRGERLEMPRLQ
jgi:hypothetical protein